MQNRIPSTSLVSQYKLFYQRYSLEQTIKYATLQHAALPHWQITFLQILDKTSHKVVL